MAGLPHSGISGSTPADGSPKLFAAFHALHRLVTPRHPPCAFPSSASRSRTTPSRQDRLSSHHSSLLNEQQPRPESHDHLTVPSRPGLPSTANSRRLPTVYRLLAAVSRSPYPVEHRPPKTARLSPDRTRTQKCLVQDVANCVSSVPAGSQTPECRSSGAPLSRSARRLYHPEKTPCKSLYIPGQPGGDGRIRTPDLPRARRALSH